MMNDEIKWALIGLGLGVFSTYDWYRYRKSVSFRGPIRLIGGIFLICFGAIVLVKNLIASF